MRKQRETGIRRAAAFSLWLSYLALGVELALDNYRFWLKSVLSEGKSKCDTVSAFSGWRHVVKICSVIKSPVGKNCVFYFVMSS